MNDTYRTQDTPSARNGPTTRWRKVVANTQRFGATAAMAPLSWLLMAVTVRHIHSPGALVFVAIMFFFLVGGAALGLACVVSAIREKEGEDMVAICTAVVVVGILPTCAVLLAAVLGEVSP